MLAIKGMLSHTYSLVRVDGADVCQQGPGAALQLQQLDLRHEVLEAGEDGGEFGATWRAN